MTTRLSRRDWSMIICGALVLVASFLPWESATSSVGYNGSASAWNAGFAAWAGSLLCAAAAAAVAAKHLGYAAGIRGLGPNLVVFGLAVAGAALLVIRILTLPRGSSATFGGVAGGYSYGPGFGAFAGAGFAAVQAIVALLSLRASGERLPATWPQAAPESTSTAPGMQPAQDPGLAQRLARLDDLRTRGMISDSEHAEQRRRILSQL